MAESGGYDDVIFLVPPSKDFQCIICLLTVCEPHLISCCGAIICKSCMPRANVNEVCPQCRDTNHIVVPDKRTKGQTMNLKVKCTNEGCKWTGELIDYHQHVEQKCSSRIVKCKYGCGQYFLASCIETHEVGFCTKRPSDVIISYQQRLIQAMEKEQLQLQQKSAEEVQKLKTENQSYKNRLSNLEGKLTKMSATHADSISKIQSLEKERTTLQLQLKKSLQAVDEKGKFASEIQSYQSRLSDLEKKLAKVTDDSTSRIQSLEKERNTLRFQLEDSLNVQEEESRRLTSENQFYKKKLSDLEQKYTSSNTAHSSSSARMPLQRCPFCYEFIYNLLHFQQKSLTCDHCRELAHPGRICLFDKSSDGNSSHGAVLMKQSQEPAALIKNCPCCNLQTRNDTWCNKVSCTNCSYEFCWQCENPWNSSCQDMHWFRVAKDDASRYDELLAI